MRPSDVGRRRRGGGRRAAGRARHRQFNLQESGKSFLAGAVCEEIKTAARAKIPKIAADAARQEEACRREDVELSGLKAQGADAREKLIDLKRRLSCPRLRPVLEAALEQIPAPPGVNTKTQIRSAQTQLHRLGCLAAIDNGKLDSRTGEAKPTEVRITDHLLGRLEGENARVCAPPTVAAPEPSVDKLLRRPKRGKENVARLPPREEPRPSVVEPKPPREKAARPAPAEKPTRLARPHYQPAPTAQSSASKAAHPAGRARCRILTPFLSFLPSGA